MRRNCNKPIVLLILLVIAVAFRLFIFTLYILFLFIIWCNRFNWTITLGVTIVYCKCLRRFNHHQFWITDTSITCMYSYALNRKNIYSNLPHWICLVLPYSQDLFFQLLRPQPKQHCNSQLADTENLRYSRHR